METCMGAVAPQALPAEVDQDHKAHPNRPLHVSGRPSAGDSGNASPAFNSMESPHTSSGREVQKSAKANRCKGTGAFPPYHFGYGPQPAREPACSPRVTLGTGLKPARKPACFPRITLGAGLNSESLAICSACTFEPKTLCQNNLYLAGGNAERCTVLYLASSFKSINALIRSN